MKQLLAVCTLILFSDRIAHVSAQTDVPGSLDIAFNTGPGADGFVRAVALQPDGNILLGGNFNTVRGVASALIARLNPDGRPDPAFTSAFPASNFAPRIYTVAVQPDNNILVAGSFTAPGVTPRANITRLQPNGALDPTFNGGTGPNALVRILTVQPDGRIIIAGEFTTVNNTNRNRIARLNADGSLDLSFDPGTGADNIVRTVALLPSGQILVGGLFTSFNGSPKRYLARLNANGSVDSTFPEGTGPNNIVYTVAPQSEGAILIGGDFTAVNGTNINRIARLFSDGSLDSSFLPNAGASGGPVYSVIRYANGKIVIGGAFTALNAASLPRIGRLNPDGSTDSTFNPGTGPSGEVLALALQGDGMLLAGGLFVNYNSIAVGMFARIRGDSTAPVLDIQLSEPDHTLISWPATASAYQLQTTPFLVPSGWQPVTNSPISRGDRLTVTLPLTGPQQFFRLTHP